MLPNGIPHRAERSQHAGRPSRSQPIRSLRAEVERQDFVDRIRVHLLDYRKMPCEWADRVVSIEIRGGGTENIAAYWAAIDHTLRKDAAYGVIPLEYRYSGS